MKVPQKDITVLEGGTKRKSVVMTFDANSIRHIMDTLTQLYSDPAMAVVREYITNAWDSHIEARQKRPIEVFTPTSLDRVLTIKDYGVGLSEDDLEVIYSKYGLSTKRDTNEQAGMLGLGCKSGLAYTGQFSLECIKDGTLVSAVVSRNEHGEGVVEILHSEDTTEPNGVTVKIPVSNEAAIIQRVDNFLKYAPEGSTLLNGKPPERFTYSLKIDDRTYIVKGGYSKVVMGGVPYRVTDEFSRMPDAAHGYGYVHFADIGVVKPTPSREDLEYTVQTKEYLRGMLKDVNEKFVNSVIKNVESAKDVFAAYDAGNALSSHKALRDVEFRGIKLFNYGDDEPTLRKTYDASYDVVRVYDGPSKWRVKAGPLRQTRASKPDLLVVFNYTNKTFNVSHLEKCLMQKGVEIDLQAYRQVITTDKPLHEVWKEVDSVDWEDAKKHRRKRTTTAVQKVTPTDYYLIRKDGEFWKNQAPEKGTKYVVFSSHADRIRNGYRVYEVKNCVETLFPGFVPADVERNREDKFFREYAGTGSIKYRDEVRKRIDAISDGLKPYDDLIINGLGDAEEQLLKGRRKLLDKKLVKHLDAIAAAMTDPARIEARKQYMALRSHPWFNGLKKSGATAEFKKLIDQYPLLKLVGGWVLNSKSDELVEYVNAVYEYRKEKK